MSQIAFFPLLIPLTNTFFLNRPYGVIVDEGSSSVAWYVGVHAKYFTPMDFHRFPFDTQVLDMQFSFEAGEFHNKFIVLYCTDALPFPVPRNRSCYSEVYTLREQHAISSERRGGPSVRMGSKFAGNNPFQAIVAS